MDRFYWYRIDLRTEFDFFLESLKSNKFNEEKAHGFMIDSVSHNGASGRFIQSKQVIQEFANPFGDNVLDKRTVFEVIEFDFIIGKTTILQTKNPGRCVKAFFNELYECSGYALTVVAPKFNLSEIIGIFRDQGVSFIHVREIELTDIELSREAIGSLVIKGALTVNDYEKKLPLANLKHRLKKIRSVVELHGIRATIEVHNSNKIVMEAKLAKFITPIVLETLKSKV
ncbi:hypothetical protein [Pseudoalteromonas rubra]|uniref:hypothetical protein n=1 Tax=Pseudoalteromonas rubra TaxID=43658 RepID=UPI000F7AC1E4|nr:hypothetical protein [Pseudoalteromonas rubra]